jgi:hypothetical protein
MPIHEAAAATSRNRCVARSIQRVEWPAGRGAAIVLGMKLKGTIRRSDLEGGQWVLETEGGERYQLTGSLDDVKDGLAVEVEGKVDKNAMGFGMMGPLLAVQKITARP